jgi:hypothetical protein
VLNKKTEPIEEGETQKAHEEDPADQLELFDGHYGIACRACTPNLTFSIY